MRQRLHLAGEDVPLMGFTQSQWQDAARAIEDTVYSVVPRYWPEVHDSFLNHYLFKRTHPQAPAGPAEPATTPANEPTTADRVNTWLPRSAQKLLAAANSPQRVEP